MKWSRSSLTSVATILAMALMAPAVLHAGGSVVPVGSYLYANPENADVFKGRLTIRFSTPGKDRLVVAWGRKYRKDRKSRKGTSEEERQKFKPWLGKLIDDGAGAIFWHLPPDFYDIIVVDAGRMTIHEGVSLMADSDPALATEKYHKEISDSLGLRTDRIGGWDAFFDNKQFDRFETNGVRASMFLQQMRLGVALAESGAKLKGCIHSVDVVWVERAKVEGAGWQVIQRQQLYRDEIPARTFFKHSFVEGLQRVRIGVKPKEIGPIELPLP